jgi:hypothetical protein
MQRVCEGSALGEAGIHQADSALDLLFPGGSSTQTALGFAVFQERAGQLKLLALRQSRGLIYNVCVAQTHGITPAADRELSMEEREAGIYSSTLVRLHDSSVDNPRRPLSMVKAPQLSQ